MKRKDHKKIVRKPSKVYQLCPACQTTNLIRLEVDVLCGECDWMSCEEYVESGGMDNIFTAFRDHFDLTDDEVAALIAQQALDMAADASSVAPLNEHCVVESETPAPLTALLGDPMEAEAFFEEAPASA